MPDHVRALELVWIHRTRRQLLQTQFLDARPDRRTVRKFAAIQVFESVRMAAIFLGAASMMMMINTTYALIAVSIFPVVLIGSFYFFKKEGEIWTRHEIGARGEELAQLDECRTESFEIFGELFGWSSSTGFFRDFVRENAVFQTCGANQVRPAVFN